MTLYEEIYFEITLKGAKSELKKLASFLKSGELDDFFEVSSDYINYDDSYTDAAELESSIVFTNDEIGIEADEFEVEDFLDVFCQAAKSLDVSGSFYDVEDNEYSFTSPAGDSYYYDSKRPIKFNDELDEAAREEEVEDEEEE